MTQDEPIIDVENPAILNESDWIGMGKSYPTFPEKVPEALRNYRSLHLEIPRDAAQILLPNVNLTVKELIEKTLPKVLHGLVFKAPKSCYQILKPNQDVDCLRYRALPTKAFVHAAMEDLGQALLDGKKSVEDPSFPQSRLPLWVLQFWNNMHGITSVAEVRSRTSVRTRTFRTERKVRFEFRFRFGLQKISGEQVRTEPNLRTFGHWEAYFPSVFDISFGIF